MAIPAPSERNWDVYHEITFEMRSHRDVAQTFHLSTSRIGEILAQVERWLKENAPRWASELSPKLQVMVAFRTFGERARHTMSKLMQAWRDSCGERTVKRQRPGDTLPTSVTTPCHGDSRYLLQLMRVALMEIEAAQGLAKLPAAWFNEIRATNATSATEITEATPETIENSPPVGVWTQETDEVEESDEEILAREVTSDLLSRDYEPIFSSRTPDADLLEAISDPGRELPKTRKQRRKELMRKLNERKRRGKLARA